MILRFITRRSNGLVLVPNIRENVRPESFAGIWGSKSRAQILNEHQTLTK
jgi:hypothetical protein